MFNNLLLSFGRSLTKTPYDWMMSVFHSYFAIFKRRGQTVGLERSADDRRYRRILEQSREVICETDVEGRWTYLNPAWTTLTGQDPTKAIGTSFLQMIESEDRQAVVHQLNKLYSGDIEECTQELRFRHASGEVRWASVRSHLMRNEHDKIIGSYGHIHDVTDRRMANDARLETERLYRLLADNSNDMIVRLSLEGIRRYVSPASFNLLGYTPEELLNQPAAGAVHPDDRATAIATCKLLLDGVENPMCVYRQLRKDGTYVWLEASYRLIRDDAGSPLELIATVRDVSMREKVELERLTATNKLSEANRLLLMAEEMSRVGHWRVDLTTGSVFWSDVVCAIHGRSSGEAPALDEAIAYYHPDDRARVEAAVGDAAANGTPFGFEARIVRSDGVTRHVVSSGRAETGPDGSVLGLFGVLQDITEAHDANTALENASRDLRDSNRLLTMAETVGKLGHWRIDYRTERMLWSDEVYRIYGLPADTQATARNALSVYHPDDVDAVVQAVERSRETNTGYTSQARLLRKDGSTIHIVTRAEIEFDAAGAAVALFGIVQDVTERVSAQTELKENEARFRLLTEQASDVISLHDVYGKCLFVSPSIESVLGYAPTEIRGRALRSLVLDEDQSVITTLRRDLTVFVPGDVATGRFRIRGKDGTLVWIEASARVAEYCQAPRIVVVSRNVTDQVRVEGELEAARDRAEDAARAKSSFLANMSHEIRTPMNGVIGFTDLMLAAELPDEQRRRAEMIADSGRAMMQLLNDVLDLSKVEAGQMIIAHEPFDLAHTLEACMKLVTPALEKKSLGARFAITPDTPWVVGDALRIRQIVLNLLGNAAKFTERGSVALRVSRPDNADTILIAVEDTGIGIAAERQAAIFEQFTQEDSNTASRFGGTGLGLTISARLAALMGGELTLDSEPGRGTTFYLSLPLPNAEKPSKQSPSESAATQDNPIQVDVHRPRILVAEDHEINQLLITESLSRLGYDCDIAHNGAEAVAMVQSSATERNYIAVLMDMRMPEMDGIEATRAIRAAGVSPSTLPIIALTANAYADDIAACLDAGMQAHLAKPVSRDDLLAALRRWSVTPSTLAPRVDIEPPIKPSLQERYAVRRTVALEAVSRLIREGHVEEGEIANVIDLLHKLAGTAGMFGEGVIGDHAREIEIGLQTWSPEERARLLQTAYEKMQRAAA